MSSLKTVFDFLNGKTFYLATVDGDLPKVRPFAFVMEFEGKLYFATNETKPSYRQLAANPNFEISATTGDGGEWVRLTGRAVFDDRAEVRESAFNAAPYLREMYGAPGSPALKPFYVDGGVAVFQKLREAAGEAFSV